MASKLLRAPSNPSSGMTLPRGTSSSSSSSSKRRLWSIPSLLTHGAFGLMCFYLGLLVGMSGSQDNGSSSGSRMAACPPCPPPVPSSAQNDGKPSFSASASASASFASSTSSASSSRRFWNESIFPPTLSNMFINYATVSRTQLNDVLEVGVPLDDIKGGAEDALILYTSQRSLPTVSPPATSSEWTATQALENCRTVKLILMETAQQHAVPECLAILPQWESYHVHKFMRLPPKGTRGGVNPTWPLRYVSKSHDVRGHFNQVPDYTLHIKPSLDTLVEYLQQLDTILDELKPILANVTSSSSSSSSSNRHSNAILVQVCNYGQVELLYNFWCNAKAKGIYTHRLLVFATDLKTLELCRSLGVPAYYHSGIFENMPEQAALGYGDRIFTKMMMAKVYCVHLVLTCGYHVVFQDVDVVWYQNPLDYLEHAPELQEWDLMFQDDGARSIRYAPYSPNTGFYFVRHSPETLFFFNMLLKSGDNVVRMSSHQAALTALLNEHASWKGLRVKVWKRGDTNPFPGGVEYHRHKDYMKRLLKKNKQDLAVRTGQTGDTNFVNELQVDPYLFHMSWTKNKDNKKLYLQQMGEWYLKEDWKSSSLSGTWGACLAEPQITCYYRDKPSIVPCKESPPIDAGRQSFW